MALTVDGTKKQSHISTIGRLPPKNVDHFSIEIHGDFWMGIHHFMNPPGFQVFLVPTYHPFKFHDFPL